MTNTIKSRVKDFIVENFLFGDASQTPADDSSFIESDIIDSTGVLELVAFIEEEFGIAMSDADIVPANLDSLNRVVAFVTARSQSQAAE